MTIRNLDGFFKPSSIALFGPGRYSSQLTGKILESLQNYDFPGRIDLINIDAPTNWKGTKASHLGDLPAFPDLVVFLGEPDQLPHLIGQLGDGGTRAVLIPSSGFESWPEDLLANCRGEAEKHGVRLIGPGSLGIAVPSSGLNALMSAEAPLKGDVAFISRSSAVLNATLSWAKFHNAGFSAVVSLGDRTDVDIGDLIDFFAQDYRTRSIVLHLEGIAIPRKFISAARAAARTKPVIVIRSGKSRDTWSSGMTHAGNLARTDQVYESVFRRTGLLRVHDLDEMFEALETLSRLRVPRCEKMAVIANGRSLANLAIDRLMDLGGAFAELGDETRTDLQGLSRHYADLADTEAAKGSVILKEDLNREGMTQAITTVLKDKQVDGVVVLEAASAFQSLQTIATAIIDAAEIDRRRKGRRKALVASLVGCEGAIRAELSAAHVPNYPSPAEATRGLMHLAHDAQAREFLMAAPPSLPTTFSPNAVRAREIVEGALDQGRSWLDPEEVCQVLEAYDLPIMATKMVKTPEEAAEVSIPFFETTERCVVKLISPDLPFKSRIDGVRLSLESPTAVEHAARELIERTQTNYPDARIDGISVHPMLDERHTLELYMGLAETPAFGPVLVFGHGGTSIEESEDVSLELPPLDLNLASALIDRTRISRFLDGGPARASLDRAAVAQALVKLSQITIDIPEILELDINPIVALTDGVIALDARMSLCHPEKRPGRTGGSRLAIAPYPKEWEQTLHLKDGQEIFVRPVRPEDEDLFKDFFEAVTPEDLRLRFFAPVRDFSHRFLARLTQLDYARAMAFAALDPRDGTLLGVVRLHADPDHQTGEYAVMVRSDLKGLGLGWALMKFILKYAKADGIETIKGEVLKENTSMITMCQALGFKIGTSPDDPGIALVTLPVTELPD